MNGVPGEERGTSVGHPVQDSKKKKLTNLYRALVLPPLGTLFTAID